MFQVGTWVTLRASSRRHREQRAARTPALITAITIEGLGAATVLHPNPLALQFGFKGLGWKRHTNVPFAELQAYAGPTSASLEAALLANLRALRAASAAAPARSAPAASAAVEPPSEPSEAQKRLFEGQRESAGAKRRRGGEEEEEERKMLAESLEDAAAAPERLEASTQEADANAERPSQVGLRQWMRPGSVWESGAAVSFPTLAPTGPSNAASDKCPVGLLRWMQPGRVDTSAVSLEVEPASPANEGTTEHDTDACEEEVSTDSLPASPSAAPQSRCEDAAEASIKVERQEAMEIETGSIGDACACPPVPPSPEICKAPASPCTKAGTTDAATPTPPQMEVDASTPSPRKPPRSAAPVLSPPQPVAISKLNLRNFTAAVARSFEGKGAHIAKAELFELIKARLTTCGQAEFQASLLELDRLNKVMVIDDLVFTL